MSVNDSTHGVMLIPLGMLGLGMVLGCFNRTLGIGYALCLLAVPTLFVAFFLGLHFMSGGLFP